jgi:hypothetical protein
VCVCINSIGAVCMCVVASVSDDAGFISSPITGDVSHPCFGRLRCDMDVEALAGDSKTPPIVLPVQVGRGGRGGRQQQNRQRPHSHAACLSSHWSRTRCQTTTIWPIVCGTVCTCARCSLTKAL